MKSPEDVLKAQRWLRVWSGTRKIAGILAIIATLVMIVSASIALKNEEDTSQAIRAPIGLAILLLALFVHSTKRIRKIEALLR